MGFNENHISRAMGAASRLRVKSALNPALWLCGIVGVPAIAAATFMGNPPIWLVTLACTPVAVASFGYLFLLFFDRDRLHSEDFQLRKQSLELIEQKGDLQAVDASTISAIANPSYLAIEDRSEESGE